MKADTHPKPHQWTNGGETVLIVKVLNPDGTGYNGFVWPKVGPVSPDKWSREPDCNSGGLFGWPWGIGIGDGKEPNAVCPWLVFEAKPQNVIGEIEDGQKCKAVPGEDGELPKVVFYGTQAGAMAFTQKGRQAWIVGNSSSASSSGDSSSASSSGNSSSASSSGYRSSASSSGDSSSASSSGDRSSASSSGDRSVAVVTGEYSTIEIGSNAIGAVTSNRFTWKAKSGAKLICQWTTDGKKFHVKMMDASKLKLKDGAIVKIQFGKIVSAFKE